MNKSQLELLKLLNSAINKEKISLDKDINWEAIINEAQPNKIEALIYTAIDKDCKENIEKELLNKLKKDTFYSGVNQLNHIKKVSHIIDVFNSKGIDLLVLKGLVIRELYPSPELRTMSDADVVVKESNLEEAKNLMLELGYIEYESSPSHYVYIKGGCLPIELHWNLADEHFFKNISLFEEDMWPNIVNVNIGGSNTFGMGLEDLAIYLSIHMAKHFVYRGFGIRHLCDFVLLVRERGNEINWSSFIDRCYKYGIGKFTIAMFRACNKLFSLEVPNEIVSKETCSEEYVDLLIEDIFSGGVHGKHDFTSAVASEFAYTADKDGLDNESVTKRFIRYLFPHIDSMSDKYNYAKENKILTPIAWIHHVFAGIFNEEYSIKDKIKFTTSVLVESKKRNNLMEWLEL